MSQIMRYHRYPAQGKGKKSIEWKYGSASATLSADFGATHYRWDEMLDNYRGQYTATQADAVATVMYHFGIACDVEYTPDSGAFIDDAFMAAINHFGYSTSSVLADREYFDDPTWTELVFDAISAGIPVYYGGYTASYLGHAFVIDGYDADGKAHVNWGFGAGGGYYDMSSLGSYVYGQSAMLFYPGQRPDGLQSWMVCSGGINVSSDRIDLSDTNGRLIVNADIKNFTGEAPAVTFGLELHDANGIAAYATGETLPLPDNRYTSLQSFSIPARAFNVKGSFEAIPVYRLDTSDSWLPVKMLRKDVPASFQLTITDSRPGQTGIDDVSVGDRPLILTDGNIISLSPGVSTVARIYDLNGRLVTTLTPSAPVSHPLAKGIYVITADSCARKVVL